MSKSKSNKGRLCMLAGLDDAYVRTYLVPVTKVYQYQNLPDRWAGCLADVYRRRPFVGSTTCFGIVKRERSRTNTALTAQAVACVLHPRLTLFARTTTSASLRWSPANHQNNVDGQNWRSFATSNKLQPLDNSCRTHS